MAGAPGAQGAAARRNELNVAIRGQLSELDYPLRSEARAASELSHCAVNFNLVTAVRAYPPAGAAADHRLQPQQQQQSEKLVCLVGNLAFWYGGKVSGIPICVYAVRHFPDCPPVVFVDPPPGTAVPPGHTCVRPDGLVRLVELEQGRWQAANTNLYSVLYHLQLEFARLPPLVVDPHVAEHRDAVAALEQRVRSQLEIDFVSARMQHTQLSVQLQARLKELVPEDDGGDPKEKIMTPARELRAVREARREIETFIEEYGMRDGDIEIQDLVVFDGSNLDDREGELVAEESAIKDTLETVADALGMSAQDAEKTIVNTDAFTKIGMKIAADLYGVRENLRVVAELRRRSAQSTPEPVAIVAGSGAVGTGSDNGGEVIYCSSSMRATRKLSTAT